MKITEQDIFRFVFYKDSLDESKKLFLAESSLFNNAIEFYQKLKDSLTVEIPDNVKKMIAEKIPSYEFSNVIRLFRIDPEIKKKKQDVLVLAAASEKKEENRFSSFMDENKEYLVRLEESENRSRIFVFSTKSEQLKKFTLTILPSDKKISFEDNTQPIELSEKIKIDSFQLEFN